MNKLLLSSALLLSVSSVQAIESNLWDNVSLSYQNLDIEEANLDSASGIKLSGSKLITDNLFILGSYNNSSIESSTKLIHSELEAYDIDYTMRHNQQSDTTEFSLGLGYKYDFSDTAYMFGSVSHLNNSTAVDATSILEVPVIGLSENESNSESYDFNYTVFEMGSRVIFNEKFEVNASFAVHDYDKDQIHSQVGVLYHFSMPVSLGLNVRASDDLTTTALSLAYYF